MSRSTQVGRGRAREAQVARQRAQARRRRMLAAGAAVAVVTVVLIALVAVRLTAPRSSDPAAATQPMSSTVSTVLSALSPTILDRIGRGTASSLPTRLPGVPLLATGGKPLVLYVGAEYCPFCAAERWALAVALARFGTFANLAMARSAQDDVFPGTATLSFHGASYTSPYLAFEGVELATSERRGAQYVPLQALTPKQTAVMNTYNAPPYVAADAAGAVPFVSFANQFLMSGAAFSPALLADLTQDQIAAALSEPDSPVAQAVLGSANSITAVLCELTGGQPGGVCDGAAANAYTDVARARG